MIENLKQPELIDLAEDWSIVSCRPAIISLGLVRERLVFSCQKYSYTPNLVYRYRKRFRKQASCTALLTLLSCPGRSCTHRTFTGQNKIASSLAGAILSNSLLMIVFFYNYRHAHQGFDVGVV